MCMQYNKFNFKKTTKYKHTVRLCKSDFCFLSFQPVLHDWCNKGRGMCYPLCGMVHIKEPFLLIGRVAYVAAAGFLSHYKNGP